LLAPALERPGAVLVDATVGLGGHSATLLQRFPGVRLIGLDRDKQAIDLSAQRLEPYADRVTLVHAVYDGMPQVLAGLGLTSVDGVLFDLGVSSLQLDLADRGFAYRVDAPLDMRMDPSEGKTAAEVLNTYPVQDLARILSRYGEERFARRIAEAVVRARQTTPFRTSAPLVDLVREAIPAPARRTGGNPAKRTFQALRIEVNAELEVLRRALPAAVDALDLGGRIVVMSYHSLEDRIAKTVLTSYATTSAPVDLPFVPAGHEPALRLLTRGAERAGAEEAETNPRARSVRLRAAERVRRAAA
jgi:16S rRNA (cytosine1402-N4)-methyltransferase